MPRKKKLQVEEKTPAKQEGYSLVIKVAGQDYKTSGATIPEALQKLKIPKIAGKVQATVLRTTARNGDKSYTFELLKPWYFGKVLASPEYAALFEKRARLFLGEINL